MENPEEVLQALDEFQKLRPADIPKELEEYLSWVAKTGDPVYQWPLIKALFREKLLRVMTDFYESCPSLELAPCPNVEQFNYDIMKSALLDRLESFANAPFTVQRICELLTAPRKEYNRVDKFMRAIEKNILVVSTREPGPTARRSENGDGMVNGSTEDNGSRSPYDMDLWARACTLATTVTVQTVESHSTIVNIHHLPTNIIPATELTIVKSNPVSVEAFTPYGADGDICDSEITTKNQDLSSSTFTPSTSEIANIANLTSQIQPQDPNSTSGIQNLSNMVPEPANIVGDVPEAIMNEDTNSQPSLDMESNENESFESTRKLQTTFQSSDFITHNIKSQKFYPEEAKPSEKTGAKSESLKNDLEPSIEMDQKSAEDNMETNEASIELKSAMKNEDSPTVPAAVIAADSIEMTDNIDKTSGGGSSVESAVEIGKKEEVAPSNKSSDEPQVTESMKPASENVTLLENEPETAPLNDSTEKGDIDCAKVNLSVKEAGTTLSTSTSASSVPCTVENNVKILESATTTVEKTVVRDSEDLEIRKEDPTQAQLVEKSEPATKESKESDEVNEIKEELEENKKVEDLVKQPSITIEEISGNNETETKSTNSIVPDPLPIIEEPKNEESILHPEENEPCIEEAELIETKSVDTTSLPAEGEKEPIDSCDTKTIPKVDSQATDAEPDQSFSKEDSSMIADTALIPDVAPAESMEVDATEGNQTVQQDEPMEEEACDLDKS